VCDDDAVAAWAAEVGASVIWRPGRGLNAAVADGVEQLAADGFDRVIVAHADLPHALDLAWVADFDGVTLVPDRHDDGTNVLSVATDAGFRFAYGAASFARHVAEAGRLGLPLRVERSARLGWDVDLPADLATPDWLAS
jgi:2-phospho-L-lactate guanylyltransferase